MKSNVNYLRESFNIVSTFSASAWGEVWVQEFPDKSRHFWMANTHCDKVGRIDEDAARAMCITPDSNITEENWHDFCTASGIFKEGN
jgi:hypothetical protein